MELYCFGSRKISVNFEIFSDRQTAGNLSRYQLESQHCMGWMVSRLIKLQYRFTSLEK